MTTWALVSLTKVLFTIKEKIELSSVLLSVWFHWISYWERAPSWCSYSCFPTPVWQHLGWHLVFSTFIIIIVKKSVSEGLANYLTTKKNCMKQTAKYIPLLKAALNVLLLWYCSVSVTNLKFTAKLKFCFYYITLFFLFSSKVNYCWWPKN